MMNRARITRVGALAAASALAIGGLTACQSGGGESSGGDVTITWWHNSTSDPLKSLWADVASEFEADHPGVTVKVEGYQNEELQRTLIPNALRSGGGVDLFQAWGGGEIKDQVAAGYVKDISDAAADTIEAVGPVVSGWQVDGKTYGLPFQYGIEGFWYNTDLFAEAGIDAPPTTLDELYTAIDKLKAAGITPIAVGAGDKWPAAHYWYNFALKSCSPDTLKEAQSQLVFDDPCFVEAGELLQEFIDSEPFQDGFLATSAQQGAGSSAGMLATGKAAMELMGHWNPGVMGGILKDDAGQDDATPPEFLGWFNFPGIDGTAGDPTAALGGGDGFACAQWAPDECVELLEYIESEDVQSRFGEIGAGIPVLPAAASSITDPNLQQVLEGLQSASYVQLWLDTAYGPTVGGAMNDGIVALFGGQGTPEDIVKAMQDAAATL
ncbi:extracellular solute-binding protein [Homoserinibacter sp. GY 40078]|uniref:extracellular solute-binding protein n=1 Tax=Homoserinibacter sp. GY 40078 TaxID=2603275 RepID=UPI0011CAFF6F|nr:extracellular solute-binding protein [Homoserinibacter sp. GY 40078]TXK18491.1 extracellular solute-binding protein [Homoserinibacter sp. GY 40078]